MKQIVSLKGVNSGIVLQLDPEVDFEQLYTEIGEKFEKSASFFGDADMVLSISGRNVTGEETDKILSIIGEKTRLRIVAVMSTDEEMDEKCRNIMDNNDLKKCEKEIAALKRENESMAERLRDFDAEVLDKARIHMGTLRSGSSIVSDMSIIVLGDVKQGAEVVAGGSVFVMGSLLGTATAGAMGDKDAFVMATHLDPLQVRIADSIAISEDKQTVRNKGLLRRMKHHIDNGPEVAAITDGHILIKDFDKNFLENSQFLKKHNSKEQSDLK